MCKKYTMLHAQTVLFPSLNKEGLVYFWVYPQRDTLFLALLELKPP